MKPTEIQFKERAEILLETPTFVTLRQIWERRSDNGHLWVITIAHILKDPEQALDNMELGPRNLGGFSQVHCFWCKDPYREGMAGEDCPETSPTHEQYLWLAE